MGGAVVIADDRAEVVVCPQMGAGLARYDLLIEGRREPILRPAPDAPRNPFELALNLLIPWSNRISGGGFRWRGTFHPLPPNLAGEAFPIHGDAFAGAWRASEARPDAVRLTFANSGIGPFSYEAEIAYRLAGGALTMELAIVSRSAMALPFGFGFHPWFVRSRETWLQAPATTVWLEDERHLPAGSAPVRERPEWDFTSSRPLPAGWVNNGFEGWSGAATIDWRDRDVLVVIAADTRLSTYLVYSPSASADFFCFEPVTHPVDAHNLSNGRSWHGLVTLAPGERVETWCRFAPEWKHRHAEGR
jgi:aldose 1-epimerase